MLWTLSRTKSRWHQPRICLGWQLTAAAFVAVGLFVWLSAIAIAPGSFVGALTGFAKQPLLLALNAFPIFALLAVLWAVMGSVWGAGALTLAAVDCLSYINLLKIEGRDDPFVPADFFLIREGAAAAGGYELDMHPAVAASVILSVLALIFLAVFVPTAKPHLIARAGTALAVCLAFGVSVPTVYASKDLYNSFTVPSQYNITSVYNTLGFPYCFLHNLNLYPVDCPEGYSRAQAEDWLAADKAGYAAAPEVRPNVLFVMCEAFSDIANDPALDYPDGSENPLAPFNAIAQSERAYSGHLVVSDFGAGTANTEFDVLTGLPTRMLSDRTTSAFRTVRRNINTVPRLFAGAGYQTYFMHPGDSWFYNRSSVYRYFGIDRQVFVNDAFTDADIKGNMVSDKAFLRVLEQDFSALVAEDNPVFAYTVTIQNHQAYSVWKYNDPAILEPVPSSCDMTGDDRAILNIYLYGLADSANMAAALTKYLDTIDEPTLLVFFGDHRPTLGSDYSVYRALGMQVGDTDTPQGVIETNKTPFILWPNAAYADTFAKRLPTLDLPENGLISDHYLGAAVTELVGYTGADGYYDFLNRARRDLPVVCGTTYMRADGTFPQTLSENEALIVEKTHKYLYYRMKDQAVK